MKEETSGGLEATITPQSSSSKIKISLSLTYGYQNDTTYSIRIIRTIGGVSVPIMLGSGNDTAAVADNTTFTGGQNATFSLVTDGTAPLYHTETTSFTGLDEPNTTSPVTYHIQVGSYFQNSRIIRFNTSTRIGITASSADLNNHRSTMILEEFSTFTHNIAEQKSKEGF